MLNLFFLGTLCALLASQQEVYKTPAEQLIESRRANQHKEKKEHAEKAPSQEGHEATRTAPARTRALRPPKKAPGAPLDYKRTQEADRQVEKLTQESARLQESLAKRERLSSAPIQTPEEALEELKAGNTRFTEGRRVRTLLSFQDMELRQTLAKGQTPFAVVLTCSDSRLMDNLIFDQELGRLFTIREAGNCPDIQSLASVEYAVEHLGSKLVLVMGHTACGAVKAVTESGEKPLPGNLWSLQAAMTGLMEATPEDPNEVSHERLRRLERNNAKRQAQVILDRSEIVRHLVQSGKVKVLPAYYDLTSGKVEFLEFGEKPQQKKPAHH